MTKSKVYKQHKKCNEKRGVVLAIEGWCKGVFPQVLTFCSRKVAFRYLEL